MKRCTNRLNGIYMNSKAGMANQVSKQWEPKMASVACKPRISSFYEKKVEINEPRVEKGRGQANKFIINAGGNRLNDDIAVKYEG